jgi:hypothetical protein
MGTPVTGCDECVRDFVRALGLDVNKVSSVTIDIRPNSLIIVTCKQTIEHDQIIDAANIVEKRFKLVAIEEDNEGLLSSLSKDSNRNGVVDVVASICDAYQKHMEK